MFNGFRIYSADVIWRKVLMDLNATVLDVPSVIDVNLDELNLNLPITLVALKTAILNTMDNTKIIAKILGRDACLSALHANIVALLYRSGGMSAASLRAALGYSPDATTHTVDTAIYQLRRTYGREFIKNEDGIYKLGRI